jgi:hypothetical protein
LVDQLVLVLLPYLLLCDYDKANYIPVAPEFADGVGNINGFPG